MNFPLLDDMHIVGGFSQMWTTITKILQESDVRYNGVMRRCPYLLLLLLLLLSTIINPCIPILCPFGRMFKASPISCLYELDATTATVSAIKKRKKRGGVQISSKSSYVATTKNSNNVWIAERMIINSGK